MNKKIIGFFVCTLLITTAITAVGQLKGIFINKEDNIKNTFIDDIWTRKYGGNNIDVGSYATETTDGGYIVIGTTISYGAGEEDVWLLKIDNLGIKQWEKFYGGILYDFGNDVQQTSDGGYILTGSTKSYGGTGTEDVWLIKTDSQGNKIWDKTFGGIKYDSGSKVRETSDGGYIIVGTADATGGPRADIWLIKTDNAGNLLWDKKFGGIGHNWGSSIDLTTDGGYIIVGASFVRDQTDDYDVWLIKTDNAGNLLWDKKFNGYKSDFGMDVQQTTDGGYIFVGDLDYDYPNCKIWLVKTDENGEFLWDRNYGSFADDTRGYSVRQTDDDGYILVGCMNEENIYGSGSVIIKIDPEGNKQWDHYIRETGNDGIVSVEQTSDGGYILTGEYVKSILSLNSDLLLIKMDKDGKIPDIKSRYLIRQRFLDLIPDIFRILQILI